MKLPCTCVLLAVALLACAGCGKKEITSLQRKQAANYVSEAQFALTVREYPRAEGLFAQAADLCPDNGVYWVSLGTTRMRMGQKSGARTAYKHALSAFEDAASADKKESDPAMQQIYVLALLGRIDDARALAAKLPARYPGDRDVQAFIDEKRLDQFVADPEYKKIGLN